MLCKRGGDRSLRKSRILTPCQQHSLPRQPHPRFNQSLVQVLFQLCLGRKLGPVLGHGDAVFVHLQQFHLFAAGFGAQDEANGGLFARPSSRMKASSWRRMAASRSASSWPWRRPKKSRKYGSLKTSAGVFWASPGSARTEVGVCKAASSVRSKALRSICCCSSRTLQPDSTLCWA